jgi:hypothetical protein
MLRTVGAGLPGSHRWARTAARHRQAETGAGVSGLTRHIDSAQRWTRESARRRHPLRQGRLWVVEPRLSNLDRAVEFDPLLTFVATA